MRNDNFEKKLKRSLHQLPVIESREHFGNTLMLFGKEACERQKRKRISFAYFLSMQIRFIGWKIWGIQSLSLLLIGKMLFHLYGDLRPQYMIKLLFCLSVLVFMTALPFIYRSVRWQMQEIEAAARFSSIKLLMAKLVVIGMGDIWILSGIFLTVLVKTPLRAESAIFYLCFPFLLTGSGCLFMLGHLSPGRSLVGSMGLCSGLMLAFAFIPGRYEFVFQQSFSAGWIIICALLLAFCVYQFRYIIYRSAYMEMQVA
ncbi:MAG: hypothetical protein HDQ96_04915 [Lachnospiraceae bacterium]|nr:hypothetical protein [Lachnospiraceae bacterium]